VKRERFVLDTSAILTLIEDERGAQRVEEVLKKNDTFLPWVALLETTYVTLQERGQAEAERRYALLKQLPSTTLWNVDEPTLLKAAELKANHRISFADSVMCAYAVQNDAVLIHKDPEFTPLAAKVRMEALPFKK
jgi:predicted nucleic acid-binding protein